MTELDLKLQDLKNAFNELKEENKRFKFSNSMLEKELQEYRQLDEQGLLLKLPCKVGDTIYLLDYEERKFDEATVEEIMIDSEGLFINTDYANYLHTKLEYVFLTKVEAQTALEKIKHRRNIRGVASDDV